MKRDYRHGVNIVKSMSNEPHKTKDIVVCLHWCISKTGRTVDVFKEY